MIARFHIGTLFAGALSLRLPEHVVYYIQEEKKKPLQSTGNTMLQGYL